MGRRPYATTYWRYRRNAGALVRPPARRGPNACRAYSAAHPERVLAKLSQ